MSPDPTAVSGGTGRTAVGLAVMSGCVLGLAIGFCLRAATKDPGVRVRAQWKPYTPAEDRSPPWDGIPWLVQQPGRTLPVTSVDGRVATPRPPVLHAELERTLGWGGLHYHRVSDGWLVLHDRGEFGSALLWSSMDGSTRRLLSKHRVLQFLVRGDEIFGVHGIAHLGGSEGGIVRIGRSATTGQWMVTTLVDLLAAPTDAAIDSLGRIVVATTHGVIRVGHDGVVEKLIGQPWMYAESVAMAADDTIYVGLRGGILRLDHRDTHRVSWTPLDPVFELALPRW